MHPRTDVAQFSERWSSVTPPKNANPTIDLQEQNEEITMHRYETSTPRVASGITAVAMTAITIGVLVVVPARMEANGHEPSWLATSKVATLASTSAVTGGTIDVVSPRVPGMATAPCKPSKSNRTPQAWVRRSPSQSSGARGSGLVRPASGTRPPFASTAGECRIRIVVFEPNSLGELLPHHATAVLNSFSPHPLH